MAKKDKRQGFFNSNKKIKNNLDLLSKNMDSLYQDTYYNSKDNVKDFENIRGDIEKSVDDIMMNTYSNTSIGNISKIYGQLKLKNVHNNQEVVDAMNIFEDPLLMNDIMASYSNNKWIRDMDYEIDTILKYMPKLKEALNCKRDSVLSADHFSRDFVNFHNTSSVDKQKVFAKRMEEIKKTYKLPENFEEWYDRAQTYGEEYIYIVPYSSAFSKLLQNKNNTIYQAREMSIITEGAFDKTSGFNNIQDEAFKSISGNELNIQNLTVTFNRSGVLTSAAEGLHKAKSIVEENKIESLTEAYKTDYLNESSKTKLSSPIIPDDLELPKGLEDESTANEGIFTIGSNKGSGEKIKINTPGCIVKPLDRGNILPIYIENVCLGYYYLEIKGSAMGGYDQNYIEYSSGINSTSTGSSMSRMAAPDLQDSNNNIINYIAKQLSDSIDSTFINANQDLRKELYMILKHNEIFNSPGNAITGDINVTFIPAEDIVHIAFKKDPITHRGISDLAMSMFPAKLYASLYITYVLGTLTRGQDKRVYYVSQNVETNISKTLLNVLNQIKKGNFGTRQMENLNSILNITGRFNDYIIPMSQSGVPPIQFEIMEGQKFDFQSELMDKLEEMAVNTTDVPIELINARQSLDYAIQATMSNSKFMRNAYKRQDIVQAIYSDISTKIYNYEYMEMENIELTLPAPAFLNMTNGAQLVQGTVQYVETLSAVELAGEDEEVRNEFIKLGVNHYLATHIDMTLIDKLREQAKINVSKDQNAPKEEE